MRRARLLIIIMTSAAAVLLALLAGCDRMTGDQEVNQAPEVEFINVPLDSTEFNYAPEVHWTGYDPDGLIDAYQYYDDSSPEAVAAYRAGDAELEAYINSIPEGAWVTTDRTSETIYLLTTEGDTTEHVFMVRAVDNEGAVSPVKVRIFFRTNQPPNSPRLRWVLGSIDYVNHLDITDTLFWGDTLTLVYNGVQFLWQGSDPDSRALNIIPLEFSYLLVNNTTGDTAEVPVVDDSLHVIGYRRGWSDWSDNAQTTFYGLESGNFTFSLRVRDDGLTESDTVATATFYAIKPERNSETGKQLLIVDENKPLTGADAALGGYHPDSIMAFYQEAVPRAYQMADQIRLAFQPPFPNPDVPQIPPFDDFENDVVWYNNRNAAPIPYAEIHKYKWVWVISDDNASQATNVEDRTKVLTDYMNVGGCVMITGRSLFSGSFGLPSTSTSGPPSQFLQRYFGLFSVRSKPFQWRRPHETSNASFADFGGATTAEPLYSDLEVDSALVQTLQFGVDHVSCLPNVDYFGRNVSQINFDYSASLYNYVSCTANQPFEVTNADLAVNADQSTPSRAVLEPAVNQTRITNVTRVYNITKGVFGDFQFIDENNRIIVSTPASAGVWTTADSLQVDFLYIPVSLDHDQPVGLVFSKYEGVIEFNNVTGEVRVEGISRFRSSLFSFPFSFIKNDEVPHPLFPVAIRPVDLLIANQFIWFNSYIDFRIIEN